MKIHGPDHPATLMIVFNIGNLLKQQGTLEESITYLEQAHKGFEKALGADHQFTKLAQTAINECRGITDNA